MWPGQELHDSHTRMHAALAFLAGTLFICMLNSIQINKGGWISTKSADPAWFRTTRKAIAFPGKNEHMNTPDTSLRIAGEAAKGLSTLCEAWHAPSQIAAFSAMIQFFLDRHINPLEEKAMSVSEQLAKLKDTVISFYRTAEKKQAEQLVRQLAELRVIAEQAYDISQQAILKSDFSVLAEKSLKNDGILYEQMKKGQEQLVNLITERVGRGNQVQGIKIKLRDRTTQLFDDISGSRNAMGTISKEKLKELELDF